MNKRITIASMVFLGLLGWSGLSSISMAADTETAVKPPLSPMEAYAAREKTADATSAQSLYELANWAAKAYPKNVDVLTRADAALTSALKIDPDHMRSTLLKRQVQGALKLLTAGKKPPTNGKVTPRPGPTGEVKPFLISEQDMYWIRLRELQGKQVGMKIDFTDPKLLHQYISLMQGEDAKWQNPKTSKRFLALPRIQQVREIEKNFPEDKEMLKKIQIKGDPAAFLKFRRQIWPLYKKGCASAKCHGGANPKGKLRFMMLPGKDARVDYTNFVILSGFKSKDGKYLIDRQQPEESLILKYAVPRNVSNAKHPVKIDPLFKSVNDPRFKLVLNWIEEDLVGPRTPDYYLTYKYPYSKLDVENLPSTE